MLNTLRGDGFARLLTLISIKIEHPRPLQVCTNVCIIFADTGAGVIRNVKCSLYKTTTSCKEYSKKYNPNCKTFFILWSPSRLFYQKTLMAHPFYVYFLNFFSA